MMMACMLCGSTQKKQFDRVRSFGFPLVYYQCERCGLVFQSTEESQAVDPVFYAETYRKVYQASAEPTAKDLWVQSQRAAHLLSLLRGQTIPNPQRVLDVGASAGVLLAAFQKALGSDVMGVEPGDAYRAYAEGQGITMMASLDALIRSNPERFELITMMHVLEHLPDPVKTLRILRTELLATDGYLLLEVPNFYAHDSYELAHLVCYTPHTLRETLRQGGFRVVKVWRHGLPRSARLNLYLTVLAQPQTDTNEIAPVKPERFVRLKRQAGMLYRRVVQKILPDQAWLPLPEDHEV